MGILSRRRLALRLCPRRGRGFSIGRGLTEDDGSGPRKPLSPWKVSDLDVTLSEPVETWDGQSTIPEDGKASEFLNEANRQGETS